MMETELDLLKSFLARRRLHTIKTYLSGIQLLAGV